MLCSCPNLASPDKAWPVIFWWPDSDGTVAATHTVPERIEVAQRPWAYLELFADATLHVSALECAPMSTSPTLRWSEQNQLHSLREGDCNKMTVKSISILQLSFSSVSLKSSKLDCSIAVQDTWFKILIMSRVRDEVRIEMDLHIILPCCPSNS